MEYETLNLHQQISESDPFTLERYEQFVRHFPTRVRSVLDVGCNTGRGGSRLKELRPEIVLHGLDCVQSRLDRLPAAYAAAHHGVSTQIPSANDSFDVIVAGEFLEHIYPRDVDATLCEFHRVLKIGGRVLLTTPNPRYLKRRWSGESILNSAHLTQHYPEVLALRLRMHGYSRVRMYGSGKVSRYLHEHLPLPFFGSFLVTADKH